MRIVTWFFAIIGFFTVLCVVLAGYGIFVVSHRHHVPEIADNSILRLNLNQAFSETEDDPLRRLSSGKTENFQALIATLRAAAKDDRIKGLVATAGESNLGFAQIQEFRDTLAMFRAKGKFAYGFAESVGDFGGGSLDYYLLSGFDKIWLQPIGNLGLTGLDMETPFVKGTLDKLGVSADFSRRGQYKSAMTELTETKLLPSDRAALDGLVHSLYDQLVSGIGQSRHLPADKVQTLIDAGPYLTDDAQAARLIDHVGYHDEFEADALNEAGGAAAFVDLDTYEQLVEAMTPRSHDQIALIRAVGDIMSGSAGDQPFGQSDNVRSDDLVAAIDAAAGAPDVKAIILRIDSPGGSDVASETIWRATQHARAKGKPVIVSMGNVAASGGYYIAAGADKIVAEPGTITGSIGVFGGKMVLDGLWQKLGVSWDHIAYGQNADIESGTAPFTPEERLHTEAMLDQSYHTFLARVAAGRHLTVAQVDAIGQGHVWTGAQAVQNGLVDTLGGLDAAVTLAKAAGNIPAGSPVTLIAYPHPKSLFQSFQELLANGNDSGGGPLRGNGALDLNGALTMMRLALDPNANMVMPAYVLER